MDKLVRRVTVVGGGGDSKVVYEGDEEENEPALSSFERAVRHMLKADLIRAQEAYDSHVASASKGKGDWLFEAPENIMKSFRKAEKEARKARPDFDEDKDKDEGD
jgi:hypothetical protein